MLAGLVPPEVFLLGVPIAASLVCPRVVISRVHTSLVSLSEILLIRTLFIIGLRPT